MDTAIKKVMETDGDGVKRQIYPETHVNAIIGISEGGMIDSPVQSVNGKTGSVHLTIDDLGDSPTLQTLKNMIEAFENGALGSNITLEEIEETSE
ncbi:hypothetical protein ACYSNR_03310 [Enterococcus sp. LJL128]